MQVTLPNKALWKIITVWRQSAPLTPQITLEMSESHWRQSILSPSDAIGKFSTQQNFQGHQLQRTCLIQHNQTKVKLMPIVLKNCNISHKKLPKCHSKFTEQWRITKLISRQKWTLQKLKLTSGWSHSSSINAMPQGIAKLSSKYPPKSQGKKIINPTDLLPIINGNKLLYIN